MTAAASGYRAPPSGFSRIQHGVAVAALTIVIAAVGLLAGQVGNGGSASAAIRMVDGVPVGIEHSPTGARVAADNYLALEQQTLERDPRRFAALVASAYDPTVRSASLEAARFDRATDPRGLALWARDGQSFTVIGAHRLDSYRGNSAVVTTWAGQIYWGPGQPPEQVWAIGQTTLQWAQGRWLVNTMHTLPIAAPSPGSTPQAAPGDESSRVFDELLGGFTPVSYGTTGP